jgi:hypothetical protein
MKRRLLSKVGAVTHVTCIERQVSALPREAPYGQLIQSGLRALEGLCRALEARPVSVMARCTASSSEVFLHLSNGAQVLYYGAVGTASDERSLWIEGPRGSLRSAGALTWWRKRGWPKFLPWRFSSSWPRHSKAAEGPLLQAIRRSSEQSTTVALNG